MNIRLFPTIILLFSLPISGTDSSPHQVNFSKLLYTPDPILSAWNTYHAPASLRPLQDIISFLDMKPSLLSTRDIYGNTLIESLINNASPLDFPHVRDLLALIIPIINRPAAFNTALKCAIKKGSGDLTLILLNTHKTYLSPSVIQKALLFTVSQGNPTLLHLLISWSQQEQYTIRRETVEKSVKKASLMGHRALTIALVERYPDTLITALKTASFAGQKNLIEVLLATKGPNGEKVPAHFIEKALYEAASGGHPEIVDYFFSLMNQQNRLHAQVIKTTVRVAAQDGNILLTFHLLHHYPYTLQTALNAAAFAGKQALIKAIFEKSTTPLAPSFPLFLIEYTLFCATKGKQNALVKDLLLWCQKHHQEISKKALEKSIQWAGRKGDKEVIMTFLQYYPTLLKEALIAASSGGELYLIHYLLQQYVRYPLSYLEETLYKAANQGYIPLVEYLMEEYKKHNKVLDDTVIAKTIKEAAQKGHFLLTFSLVHHYPEKIQIALKAACLHGHTALLQALLNESIALKKPLPFFLIQEFLYLASTKGHHAIVNSLIAWCERCNHELTLHILEKMVEAATVNGHHNLTHALITRYPRTFQIAFKAASLEGHHQLIKMLLSDYNPLKKQITSAMVEEALKHATMQGHQLIINELIAWHTEHHSALKNAAEEQEKVMYLPAGPEFTREEGVFPYDQYESAALSSTHKKRTIEEDDASHSKRSHLRQ